jgi:multidrug resistance efflux pump
VLAQQTEVDETTASSVAEPTGAEPQAKPVEEPEQVKLEGVFQPVNAQTVRIEAEEWSNLVVVEAVAHGAAVQAGDVLIKLETDKLQRAIDDTEHEIATDELAQVDAEIKLDLARRSQDLALKAAAIADREATEDLKDFVTRGRDRSVESFERSVISARNRLEYQAEELKQLERMYAADDLTEETEEIILKRTRDAVESAQYSLQVVQDAQRRGQEFDVPRNEAQLEQAVARAALALEEARRTAPQSLQRQQLQFEKQKADLQQKRERLGRLRSDLKRMVVTAPRAGVVYYGAARRGKWSDTSSIEAMLQPGGSPKVRSDLLTVVEPRPLTVRVVVPEKWLRHVGVRAEATIEPEAFPDVKLNGQVSERGSIPIGEGQFDATLALDDAHLPADVVAGMKAQVRMKEE